MGCVHSDSKSDDSTSNNSITTSQPITLSTQTKPKNDPYADNVEKLLKYMKDLDLKVEDQTRFGWWLAIKYPVVSTALLAPDNPIAVRTRLLADKMGSKNATLVRGPMPITQAPVPSVDEGQLTRYSSSPNLNADLQQPGTPLRPIATNAFAVAVAMRKGSPKAGKFPIFQNSPVTVLELPKTSNLDSNLHITHSASFTGYSGDSVLRQVVAVDDIGIQFSKENNSFESSLPLLSSSI